ncbi:hypothetical protein TanjilG_17760 [Lupinus angustifolius]|uniref:Magnesium transporter n=1 Tax=Lupinus angustifolius TaxID=3871 RepID=A0A4P1RTQ6_LUPAN|nr:hypothetical protein TanjilG_17760 [Lupinus angustifolius]
MRKVTFSSRRHVSRRRHRKPTWPLQSPASPQQSINGSPGERPENGLKAKKMAGAARLWMRVDQEGQTEMVEWDKYTIILHASIPARDLRILGPVYSHSSNILGRERAIVVNLEFIKAIITAEEVLLLEPLRQEVIPFVEQLRQQLPYKTTQPKLHGTAYEKEIEMQVSNEIQWLSSPQLAEDLPDELPFEFQVLEIALEFVSTLLDSNVAELESDAYPVLDELAKNVSTNNLDFVRSLKSNLTRLLARVQKVRDEIEHLLDGNEDMSQLYLTRKGLQNHQFEAHSTKSESLVTKHDDNDVEELEMLLEAYFMQLDATRNKILSVREYIDDTEDYVNIQLDNQRNELIQLQLTLTIASFAMGIENYVADISYVNLIGQWYEERTGINMAYEG